MQQEGVMTNLVADTAVQYVFIFNLQSNM